MQIQAGGPWPFSRREREMYILMFANEALGRSEMLTVSHLVWLRLSASVHGSWCRCPLGAARTAPGHTQHRGWALDSQVNRNRKRTTKNAYNIVASLYETRVWIGCDVRPNKGRKEKCKCVYKLCTSRSWELICVEVGRETKFYTNKRRDSLKKRSFFHSIDWAHRPNILL